MSKTNEPAAQRAPGHREGFVPRAGITACTGILLLLAAVTPSEQAVEKLRQIARQVFTEAPEYQPDHYDAATGPETPTDTASDAAPDAQQP